VVPKGFAGLAFEMVTVNGAFEVFLGGDQSEAGTGGRFDAVRQQQHGIITDLDVDLIENLLKVMGVKQALMAPEGKCVQAPSEF
jgi:hypothetical protein